MTIGLTPKTGYTIGGLTGGAVIGIVATKMMKGHICWLCVAGMAIAGGLAGYYFGNKATTATIATAAQ